MAMDIVGLSMVALGAVGMLVGIIVLIFTD